jgi:2-dehydro-3-deoxyglucarate aldolase
MNRVKEAIKERGYALGAVTVMGDLNNIEMMARAGLDYIWVEMQHSCPSPWDSNVIANMLRAAEVANSTLLIRVPEPNSALICKVLDTGVRNIVVPEISRQEEIDIIISGGRYRINKEGWRSVGTGREAIFVDRNLDNLEKINSEVMLGIVLEKKEAIDSLGKSLSLNGLDFAFIGPVDLSISLGIPLQMSNQRLIEYIEKAKEYCIKEGIILGCGVTSVDEAKKRIEEGYKLVTLGTDLRVIYQHFKNMVKGVIS